MRLESREQSCVLIAEDTLVFTWNAIIDPKDVAALFAQLRQRGAPPRYWLWDLKQAQLIPGDTRRLLLSECLQAPLRAVAVVASEFILRVPVRMILEIVQLEAAPSPSVAYFAENEAAMAWLRRQCGEAV